MHECKDVTEALLGPYGGTVVHAYDNVAEAQIGPQEGTHMYT